MIQCGIEELEMDLELTLKCLKPSRELNTDLKKQFCGFYKEHLKAKNNSTGEVFLRRTLSS